MLDKIVWLVFYGSKCLQAFRLKEFSKSFRIQENSQLNTKFYFRPNCFYFFEFPIIQEPKLKYYPVSNDCVFLKVRKRL